MQKQVDLQKEKDKALKSQVEAYIEVAKHKFGRTPTLEEVISLMADQEAEPTEKTMDLSEVVHVNENESLPRTEHHEDALHKDANLEQLDGEPSLEPEIDMDRPDLLDMMVYYGLNAETRQPDENRILFYENGLTGECYDCSKNEWLPEKPSVLDHLPCRGIQATDQDMVAAIAHGVMSESDYEKLEKDGVINDLPRAMWKAMSDLSMKLAEKEELEKSAASVISAGVTGIGALASQFRDDEEDLELSHDPEPDLEPEVSTLPAEVEGEMINSEDPYYEESGEDLVEEIIGLAMQRASQNHPTREEVAEIVRQIVIDEINKLIG